MVMLYDRRRKPEGENKISANRFLHFKILVFKTPDSDVRCTCIFNCYVHLIIFNYLSHSKEYEDLSIKARSRFSASLRSLSQPISLGDIARTWDFCARAVISEYAQQSGGGSFSSKYGTWEDCMTAA